MATRVTLTPTSSDPDAPIRVAKVQLPNDRADRQAEADWLRRAARPGIVPLAPMSDPAPDAPFTILTEHVGSRTLRTARLGPLEAWRVVVEVADLVDGLHRDGLVHGKLTVDHVILGAQQVWLCSPDGTCNDPGEDLDGLARCMRDLQRQWEADGKAAPFGRQWADVAGRLADDNNPSRSATRALQALRRLHPPPASGDARTGRRRVGSVLDVMRRRSGILTVSVAAVIAIGALPFVDTDGDRAPATGPRIEVGERVYAVGVEGDDVVVVDNPCQPSAAVIVLEASTQTVWAFDRIADGATARPVAVVPGATDVRPEWVEADPPCTVVVARGPAGVSIIDTSPSS